MSRNRAERRAAARQLLKLTPVERLSDAEISTLVRAAYFSNSAWLVFVPATSPAADFVSELRRHYGESPGESFTVITDPRLAGFAFVLIASKGQCDRSQMERIIQRHLPEMSLPDDKDVLVLSVDAAQCWAAGLWLQAMLNLNGARARAAAGVLN